MNIFTRAFKNITHQPFKSLAIFLVIAVLGTFLFAFMIIASSLDNIEAEFYKRSGNEYTIKASGDGDFKDDKALLKYLDLYDDFFSYYDIRFIDYVYNTSLESSYAKITSTSQSVIYETNTDLIKLVSGREFLKEELDKGLDVIIIRKDVAFNLEVGDTVKMDLGQGEKDYQIVGIFEYDQSQGRDLDNDVDIFIPYETLMKEYDEETPPSLWSLYIKAASKEDNAKIYPELYDSEEPALKNYRVSSTLAVYEKIAEPLKAFNSLSKIISYIALTLVIIILSVLTFLFVKERRYEFGVLLAMGETKLKIVVLAVLELLIISIFAFLLSLLLSYIFAFFYSDYLINASLSANVSYEIGSLKLEDLTALYQINISLILYLKMLMTLLLSIAIASILPTIYITNLKIRKLLL